jgi:SAM-dependent methyltransferase
MRRVARQKSESEGLTVQSRLDLRGAYRRWVQQAKSGRSRADAMKWATGAQFEAYGQIEADILRFFGLRDDATLIDVGCGAGRLAIPLSKTHQGSYLGTDIVPDLLEFARESCNRPDWRFELVDSLRIPALDQSADMVCFFSVLTHLLHEQSYLYLEEAKRVLKPDGRIVFSFLEFRMPFHWSVFASTVNDARGRNEHPLNVFIERDAIQAWATHLGLAVVDFHAGDEAFVPLSKAVTLDGGQVLSDRGNLGQSICVLTPQ